MLTNNQLNYIPEIVFIDCVGHQKNRNELDTLIRNGFIINGQKFVLSERSASMCRQGVLAFIDEAISEQLDEIVSMGLYLQETVISKWVAYRGLMLSSCFCLEEFLPKIIVVDDFTNIIPNQHIRYLIDEEVEYVDKKTGEIKKWKQKKVTDGYQDVEISPWDGLGLCHFNIMREIKERIGIEKENPTSYMVRMPFVKGIIHGIDYTSFWLEHGIETIKDIWGVEHSVRDEMIIFTKSMYKGYKYFQKTKTVQDWKDYWTAFHKYNHCFSIAKWNYSLESEPRYTRSSYQTLQTLDLSYDEFRELMFDSIDWLDKILNGDKIYTYAFLGLFADSTEAQNAYMKALLKNNEVLNDPHIKKYLSRLLKKYIDQMKCGKLWIKGAFKIACSDLVMLMEYIAGLSPIGFLSEDEFWAKNYEGEMLGEHVLNRNPHIAASESVILNGVSGNSLVSHLDNLIMINAKSITMNRLSGCDFDGDLVIVSNNSTLLKGAKQDVIPVLDVQDKLTVPDKELSMDNTIDSVLLSLDSRIGELSNIATCYLNKKPKEDTQKKRYADNVDYISVLNGKEIDHTKTGIRFNCPKFISKYAKPFPYFMKFSKPYYRKLKQFNRSPSNLNKLCWEIESLEKKLKFGTKNEFNYKIYINDDIDRSSEIKAKILEIYKEFKQLMQKLRKEQAMSMDFDQYSSYFTGLTRDEVRNSRINYDYYYDLFRKKCRKVCKNESELANYAVEICYEDFPKHEKTFAWTVAKEGIMSNLKQTNILIPAKNGSTDDCEYLGRYYSLNEYCGDE